MEDFSNLDCNFLKEWLDYGETIDKEPYKFVAYYIAFNFLYNKHTRIRKYIQDGKEEESESELNQIKNFIDAHSRPDAEVRISFSSLLTLIKPDLNNPNEKSEYLKENVKSNQKDSTKYADAAKIERGIINDKCRGKAIKELFKAIYIVRCNLFHGNKKLKGETDRNIKLLADGSKILKQLIIEYLKKTYPAKMQETNNL